MTSQTTFALGQVGGHSQMCPLSLLKLGLSHVCIIYLQLYILNHVNNVNYFNIHPVVAILWYRQRMLTLLCYATLG